MRGSGTAGTDASAVCEARTENYRGELKSENLPCLSDLTTLPAHVLFEEVPLTTVTMQGKTSVLLPSHLFSEMDCSA